MKAVILAAGTSTRLRPLTDALPKCLLPVAGVPILRRSVARLIDAGVVDVVLITGFLHDRIREAMDAWFPQLGVTCVVNEAYERTNNAASLLRARAEVEGRAFVLLDGDLVFDAAVMTRVLESPHDDVLALRRAADLGAEEMKVVLAPCGRVQALGKPLDPREAAGEAIGIARLSAPTSAALFRVLHERVIGQGLVHEWYESSFQALIDRGQAFWPVDVGDAFCTEIDTPDDLRAVERVLLEG
ncbi:NTP transferase domain-containing protein [Chondromyces crocatus]|uniref:phosphocholine cytidylyltransferase family protein n=1 Tax=Chondromyces crocatus TaxID=52 RepID=UPI0007C84295|nr:phosphocholine cytidylyltransferase family protein [Chondromyces crocatus]